MSDQQNESKGPDLTQGVPFASLEPGKPLLGHAGKEAVVLVRVGEQVHAIGATCTHYGAPLEEGLVVGETIRCPWHHACFDLRTGAAVAAPALTDNACFEVARGPSGLVQVSGKKKVPPAKTQKIVPPTSVVIVGAGAAGAACVERLRKEGYAGTITMIGNEEPGPVDRPNLSKDYLEGKAEEAWMPLGSPEHYAELRVELLPTGRVTGIDTKTQHVTLADGRVEPYGALLLCTGAEPIVLPIDGAKLPHVLTLRTLADSRAIIERAKTSKRVVILGASFIGLEVAASLVERGLSVHVVGKEDLPLARVLGDALGKHVKALHEEKGVTFHLGTSPKVIREHEVELASGEKVAADLVIMAVGVKPRTSLAEEAGITVDNGVVVDQQLRTSAAAVWAAGDIASYPDPRAGEHVRIEHWVVAERQGEHVARSMLGLAAPYSDVPFFWSKHYDWALHYMGHVTNPDDVEVHGSLVANDALIAYKKSGKTLAVCTVNRDHLSLEIERAMEEDDATALDALIAK